MSSAACPASKGGIAVDQATEVLDDLHQLVDAVVSTAGEVHDLARLEKGDLHRFTSAPAVVKHAGLACGVGVLAAQPRLRRRDRT